MTFLKQIKIKNLILITLGAIIYALGVTLFMTPVKLYDSGMSGTSMLLSQMTPDYLSLSLFLLLLNIPLFLFGLKKQGGLFTAYAIYAVAVYSVTAYLIENVLPIDVEFSSPLAGQDLLLCAIFGGVITGIGSGLTIHYGGAIDGIEIIAISFSRRFGITVGQFCLFYNILLYVICGIFLKSWILPLYSIVMYVACMKIMDIFIDGFDRAKCAIIISTKGEEIGSALSESFESGVTRISAVGGYSNTQRTMLYFVVNRFQVTKLKDIVREIDPDAFITISDISEKISASYEKK